MVKQVKHDAQRTLSVRGVSADSWRKAKVAAATAGISLGQWLEALIEKACRKAAS